MRDARTGHADIRRPSRLAAPGPMWPHARVRDLSRPRCCPSGSLRDALAQVDLPEHRPRSLLITGSMREIRKMRSFPTGRVTAWLAALFLAGCAQPEEPAASTAGLSQSQIDAMFAAAVAQAAPFEEHRAVCVAVSAGAGGVQTDPPAHVLRSVGALTRLPVVEASRCAFDVSPYVAASGARAMLYTVKLDRASRNGRVLFWAHATYGNLGANGAQFVLRRRSGNWQAHPTGVSVIS